MSIDILALIKEYWPVLLMFSGLIFSCWTYIKDICIRLWRFFIVEVHITDRRSVSGLRRYLCKNFEFTFSEPYYFSRIKLFNNNKTSYPLVRHLPVKGFLRYGWRIIYIDNNVCYSWIEPDVKIYFLRYSFHYRHFLDQANNWSINDKDSRFMVKKICGTRYDNTIISSISNNKTDNHSFIEKIHFKESMILDGKESDYNINLRSSYELYQTNKQTESIIDEISMFIEYEDWYKSKGIKWQRGYVLTSKPGGGKTSFVRYIGVRFGLPVYSFDLGSMTNNNMIDEWATATTNSPCIILFEDFDAVFNKRENITNTLAQTPGVTFDCILQCIDGINSNDGVILFITTNKPECLDYALSDTNQEMSSRPGRIDRYIELSDPTEQQKTNIATIILEDCSDKIDVPKFINTELLPKSSSMSIAQFQEMCTKIALDYKWNKSLTEN
jgi:hypothetical protein